jgi:Effector Associated Constant Component 1
MTTADGSQKILVALRPQSDHFDLNDARWARQVGTLLVDLEEKVGTLRGRSSPARGTKGGTEAIILALGSAGAITAMVEVVKAWLSRDRSRSLEIVTVDEAPGRRIITVRGDQIDDATIREAIRAVTGGGDGS